MLTTYLASQGSRIAEGEVTEGTKRRDWRAFLAARAISLTGSALTYLILPVVLFERTGSPLVTGIATSIPAAAYILFSMISGYVADVVNRKVVLYLSEIASIGALATIIVLLNTDVRAEVILAPLFVLDVVAVFFDSSSAGTAPALVPEAEVPKAISRLSAMATLIETATPALGGFLLVALSASGILAIDAASFLLSALLLMSIRTPLSRHLTERSTQPARASDRLRFALEGARFVRSSPLLFATTGCLAAQSLFVAAFVSQLTPLVSERVSPLGTGVGVALAAIAAGSFMGSLLVPRLMKRFTRQRILTGTTLTISVNAILILSIRSYPVLLGCTFLLAIAATSGIVMLSTLRVQLAPSDMVGRVVAFGRLVSWALPGLLGGVVGGAVAAVTKPEVGVATMGLAYLLVVGFALTRLARAADGADTDVAHRQRIVSDADSSG
jgi:MFS family permease